MGSPKTSGRRYDFPCENGPREKFTSAISNQEQPTQTLSERENLLNLKETDALKNHISILGIAVATF